MATRPAFLILMCTLNGARWLPGQLDSLAAQQDVDWALRISDDGSQDATRAVVGAFAQAHPGRDIALHEGPRRGPAANYLALLGRADLPVGAQTLVAFADQDDLWYPDKLARAARALAALPAGRPGIYGAQSRHVDPQGRVVGRSRRPRRPVVLGNALVQNMVSGHSLVLNAAAVRLARGAGVPDGVRFHDWWLSLLVVAAGGDVVIDPATVLDYRQHATNTLGAPVGAMAALRRAALLSGRDYAGWIAANLRGLSAVPDLPLPTREVIATLLEAPAAGPARAAAFRRAGLHRQTAGGTLLLLLAALLGTA